MPYECALGGLGQQRGEGSTRHVCCCHVPELVVPKGMHAAVGIAAWRPARSIISGADSHELRVRPEQSLQAPPSPALATPLTLLARALVRVVAAVVGALQEQDGPGAARGGAGAGQQGGVEPGGQRHLQLVDHGGLRGGGRRAEHTERRHSLLSSCRPAAHWAKRPASAKPAARSHEPCLQTPPPPAPP